MVAFTKIINWLMLILFLAALLFVPLWWLTRQGEWQTWSEVEVRNLTLFPVLNRVELLADIKALLRGDAPDAKGQVFGQFLNQSFQAAVNEAAVDQFPYRIALTSTGRALERASIRAAYSILKDPAIPASLDTDYLIMRDEQVFIQYPVPQSYVSRSTIDKRIQNYRDLTDAHPDINFFVFYLERMAFAPYNPARETFPEADNGTSFQVFFGKQTRKVDRLLPPAGKPGGT